MVDPFVTAIGVGCAGSMVAGPAVAYGLDAMPQPWRKAARWVLVGTAVLAAFLITFLPASWVYLLAVLPGTLAFLAFRTLAASALVSLAPLYFVIGDLTRGRPSHAPYITLDAAFALEPAWIFVYGSLYVFMVPFPLLVARDLALLRRAMQAYLAVMVVAYVGFLLYPTVAPRPEVVAGESFTAWALRIAYDSDPPHGCFPSLHVAYSFVAALTCYRVHRGVGGAALVWAALIGFSTLYIKQHYVVDVIAGAAAAVAAYLAILARYPRGAIPETDQKRAPGRALAATAIYAVMVAGFWVAYRVQS
jgi:membrane-associated phospholipid phosphatase